MAKTDVAGGVFKARKTTRREEQGKRDNATRWLRWLALLLELRMIAPRMVA